jgi:hypothetical protein
VLKTIPATAESSDDMTLLTNRSRPVDYSKKIRHFSLASKSMYAKHILMQPWFQKACGLAVLAAAMFELPITAQEWAWAKGYGGQGAERTTGIVLDAQGNQYAAGWFESTATFGSQTLTVTGHRDAFIGRWDASGNLTWVQKAGGKDEDYASAITVDPSGNPIVMGTFRSATAEFGGITITNKYARDYNSLFIAKLDSLGHGIWVQQVGGASTYDLASIKTDSLGNIYFVACMARFANFGVTNLAGYEDILIAKYDPDGNLVWARQAGGNGYDYGQGLAVTPAGFAYATGTFEKTAPFGSFNLTSRGNSDLFLAKYSPDGNVEWVTQAGGSLQDGSGILALDPEGGVFLGGCFRGSATIGTNILTPMASLYDQDAFFARYDGLGGVRWVRQIGHSFLDTDTLGSTAVKVTTDGTRYYTNIFLSGHFGSYVSVGSISLTNTAAQRMYLSKWDLDGEVLWVRQAGGNNSVIACDDNPDPSVFLSGQFADPAAWNSTWLLASGNSDVFFTRFDSGAPIHSPSKPTILQQPQNVAAAARSAIQLSVQIAGTAPVTYRWRKNGVNLSDVNRVFGSTTPRLNINSCQTSDAGNYTVIVTSSYGSVTSAVAVVTVGAANPESGPAWDWVRTFGGSSSDAVAAMASDALGNVYVTGYFQNTNVIGTDTLIAPKNVRSIFVAQYDASGAPQWARQVSGDKSDNPTAIATDASGNVYVTGYFYSSNAAFGPYVITNQTPSYSDVFLAKYNNQGSVQWAVSAIGTRDDASRGIAIDSDGNILIVGDFASPTLTLPGQVLTNIGGTDVFVAKFNPQGQIVWARNAGDSSINDGNAVALDAAKNVYITGELWGSIRFGSFDLDSHFDHDTFLAKYNASGDLQWARQLNSLSVTVARNLAADADGDLIMAGYLDQTCDFDDITVVAHGSQDVFVAKFNPAGEVVWARNMGGPGSDTPRSLAVDAAKNVYVTGSFDQTAEFGGVILTPAGQRDAFIVACDSSGQVSWAKQAGGTRADDGFALATGPESSIVVGGSYGTTAFFDGASYTANESSVDGFLANLTATPSAASVKLSCLQPGNVLEIRGTVGKTIIIQGATELATPIDWQPLATFVLQTSPTTWTDSQPATLKRKFYRTVIQP